MKKTIVLVALAMIVSAGVFAQQAFEKTVKLKQEEVPVVIVNSFLRDFGALADDFPDGHWSVLVKEQPGVLAKPVSYTYKAKHGHNKFEAHYAPNGELKAAKGAEVSKSIVGKG